MIRGTVTLCTVNVAKSVFAICCLLAISACAVLERNAAPEDRLEEATIAGMPPEIRALGLAPSPILQHDFSQAMVDGGIEQSCDMRDGNPVLCVLIVSGGGGFGAYGAGLLNGWTASGIRPEFKIVTGVSTGSLIAPFAFLGPDWDDELRSAFTGIESDDDIFSSHGFLGLLTSDALSSSEPLQQLIAVYVDDDLLDAIAEEHRSGRRLYVGTSNMDAQRFTIWNMGAIAASGRPEALELFRRVLLASTSVPIMTPPVFFDVEVDGESFDEMHGDGGLHAQFFVPLRVIDLPAAIREAQANGFDYTPTPRMFVIRNARFTPVPERVEDSLPDIAARTISTMIQAMGQADLYQIYAITRVRGSDFHYSEVPKEFVWNSDQEFDGEEMRRLYDVGYERGVNGTAWSETPPGLFAVNTGQ